ncbi:MAG: hypothetical protein J0L77_09960 [Alphaproteobacteria bacterium]|nr:hypothetical protein [Alphaproteobacteria bacterium]
MRQFAPLFLLFLGTILLSSCGIKPKNVDPPTTEKPDTFPQTYPTAK